MGRVTGLPQFGTTWRITPGSCASSLLKVWPAGTMVESLFWGRLVGEACSLRYEQQGICLLRRAMAGPGSLPGCSSCSKLHTCPSRCCPRRCSWSAHIVIGAHASCSTGLSSASSRMVMCRQLHLQLVNSMFESSSASCCQSRLRSTALELRYACHYQLFSE